MIKSKFLKYIYVIAIFSLINICKTSAQLNISWKDSVGVSLNNGTTDSVGNSLTYSTIQKTSSNGWGNAGAASENILSLSTNGWIEYTISQLGNQYSFGLSSGNIDANPQTINYAFNFLSTDKFNITENGVVKTTQTGFNSGDKFRIEKNGVAIQYKRYKQNSGNWVTIRTSTNQVTADLMADMSIYSSGFIFTDVKSSFEKPLIANAGLDIIKCEGDNIHRPIGTPPDKLGGKPPLSYSWSPAAGLNSTTSPNPKANPSTTTQYTLTITDNAGNISTDNMSLIVKGPPVIVVPTINVCSGKPALIKLSGAETYSWTPNTGLTFITADSVIAIVETTTTYDVIGEDIHGCSATKPVTINIYSKPIISVSPDATICSGNSTTLTTSVISSSYSLSYSWSPSIGLNSTSSATVIANPTVTTTYTVTVTDQNGCTDNAQVEVAVNPSPVLVVTPDTAINYQSYAYLSVSGANIYTWTPSYGLNTTTGTNVIAHIGTSTTYTVTGTAGNGCVAIDSATVSVHARENLCAFDTIMALQQSLDTNFQARINNINTILNDYINSRTPDPIDPDYTYVIPVVIHIVRDPSDLVPVISYAQVESQINALNKAFANGYSSPGVLAVDTRIQFCLAQTPMGISWTDNSEPGVMRYSDAALSEHTYTPVGSNLLLNLTHPGLVSSGYSPYFPFENYLNVWVVKSIDGLCSGFQAYSQTPLGGAGFLIDGVVIRGDAFGDNSFGGGFALQPHNYYDPIDPFCITAFATRDQGKILAHEVGHYLNLYHTFQEDIATGATCAGSTPATCASEGDFCCDTPPSNIGYTYTCGDPNPNTCGVPDLTEDFMFYAFDPCWNTFTAEQSARMEAYLVNFRSNLSSFSNHFDTGLFGATGCLTPQLISDFTYTPSPSSWCINDPITFSSFPAPMNSATNFNWSFPGGTPSTSTATNQIVTYATAGTYTVTLTVDDGINPPVSSSEIIDIASCILNPDFIHNTHWYFGQYATLDFTPGFASPTNVARVNNTVFAFEGSYSYSDNSGNLVFYTDGVNLWDNTHTQVNSSPIFPSAAALTNTVTGLNQMTNSVHGLMGVPFPGAPDEYYLFAAPAVWEDATAGIDEVRFVQVNLSSSSISVAQTLPSGFDMAECLTIMPHCNGQDYWIITHNRGGTTSGNFYAYLLSSLGLNQTPVVSPGFGYRAHLVSEMKGSPDNQYIILAGGLAGNPVSSDIALYNFDASSGVVSGEQIFDMPGYEQFGSCSFSSNSQQIYATGCNGASGIFLPNSLIQFDLTGAGTALNYPALNTTGYFNEIGYLQLGPDDNIYANSGSYPYDESSMSKIKYPNTPANVAGLVYGAIEFAPIAPGGIKTLKSLPNLMDGIQPSLTPENFTVTNTSCTDATFDFDPCWGGYEYTWDFGDGNSATGASVSNNYATAGTYTVTCTLTIPGGTGSIIVSEIINTSPPTLVISGGPAFVGTPTTYTITPYSSSNIYTISLVPSSSGLLGSLNTSTGTFPVTWNSTSGGTILVDVTDPNGCTNSGSLTTPANNPVCTGTIISYAIWNTSWGSPPTLIPTGNPHALYYDSEVTGNVYLSDIEMIIAPNYTITVRSGAVLTLDNCYLHACTDMWEGIIVEPGGRVEIINGTVIEDAITAVNTIATTGSSIPDIQINSAIFNKNGVNINLLDNPNDMTSTTIKDAIFTCRTLPAPSLGSFATIKAALETNTTASLTPYPTTTTIAGPRSQIGVSLTNISDQSSRIKIGVATTSANLNIFDNLDYGVYLTDSYCEIINNTFQNLTGFQPTSGLPTGIGVYGPPQTPIDQPVVNIGGVTVQEGNTFTECFRGVEISNYFIIRINNCVFNTSVTPGSFGTTPAIGANAIYLKDTPELIQIENSTMTNWETGIWVTLNTQTTGLSDPGIFVEYNLIDANSSGYCSRGMFFTDVSNTTSGPRIFIDYNILTDINNGIYASNIRNNMKIYNDNIITMRYNATGTYAGVWLDGCDLAEVKNNTILTPISGYDTENLNIRGVYANASTNNRIFCNNISAVGECLVFDGNCASASASTYSDGNGVLANDMTDARTGLKLQNSGVIGQQGASGFPSSNHWLSSALSYADGQTFSLSSAPGASTLYCLSPSTSLPTNNLNSGGFAYTTFLGLTTTLGTEVSCPTVFTPAMGPLIVLGGAGSRTMSVDSAYAEELKQLLINSLVATSYFSSANYMMQQFIYGEVKEHTGLQLDSTLNEFYINNQTTSIGLISAVNDEIRNQNFVQAAVYNASYFATNIIEENHQTFNSIYLANLDMASNYTSADSSSLFSIATQCAIDGGNAVNQSRNLLMFIQNRVITFEQICNEPETSRAMGIINHAKDGRIVLLYPNPSTGNLTLEYSLKEGETGIVNIYSVTGKLMYTYELGTSKTSINATSLENGMYMYEVMNNNKKVDSGKIVIVK